jgi:D-glycero-alpha-D-manno-heptose-7-phosphate kinase
MSFVGGGSDLPSFYRSHGGAVLSAAIEKYIYVNVNKKFDNGIRVAYSKTEEVNAVTEIEHKLVRETFHMMGIPGGVEITTIADIPSRGTGLGSSSSFTVGLINALNAYQGRPVSAEELGRESCRVEIELCGEPIGKQDQYAAAYGGLNLIEFNPDDSVLVSPVIMAKEKRDLLERRLVVFYTGVTRSASGILRQQTSAVASDTDKQDALRQMVRLAYELRDELGRGSLDSFGDILHENWRLKKTLSASISSEEIDGWYESAKSAGALGGKLLGAGGGGFLMFYAHEERHAALERALQPLRCVSFKLEPLGSRIIFYQP